MRTILHGPRRILNGTRRVCVPKALTDDLGWRRGDCAVTVRRAPGRAELLVQVADGGMSGPRDRSSSRPRLLDGQGQFTVPSVLMDELGLNDGRTWVYFARAQGRKALRLIPHDVAAEAWEAGSR